MADEIKMNDGEKILMRSRPTIRSFWVFILGFLLVGVGPFLQEDPPLRPVTGLVFAFVFLIIMLRRGLDVYTLTNQRLMVRGGIIERETSGISLNNVSFVAANQGINLRLAGAGHVMVGSTVPDEENIIMYGQLKPYELKARIERLVASAGGAVGREAGDAGESED